MSLGIQVFSDVICPWCYVGKRRLENALSVVRCRDVGVRWPDPQMPIEGMNRRSYRCR
jgi:predicted DsbA family dithiol-disulfide isomerase